MEGGFERYLGVSLVEGFRKGFVRGVVVDRIFKWKVEFLLVEVV